jgi:hypothetical protein
MHSTIKNQSLPATNIINTTTTGQLKSIDDMTETQDAQDSRIIAVEQQTSKFKAGEHYRPASLTRFYGPHWWWVLDDYFTNYIPESEPTGGNKILIGAPMPNKEKYEAMAREYFTNPIAELLADARNEVEELQQEMDDWQCNLPESLQCSTKADMIQDASGALSSLEIPTGEDIPEDCQALTALHYVLPDRSSRGRRLDEVRLAIEDCAKACESVNRDFASQLQGIACDLENIEFPGMYS